jgi:hypothetical protein
LIVVRNKRGHARAVSVGEYWKSLEKSKGKSGVNVREMKDYLHKEGETKVQGRMFFNAVKAHTHAPSIAEIKAMKEEGKGGKGKGKGGGHKRSASEPTVLAPRS